MVPFRMLPYVRVFLNGPACLPACGYRSYVVIQSTRVVTVDENRLVSASASSPQHNAFKGKAPLETAEAMVKFTVASREQVTRRVYA